MPAAFWDWSTNDVLFTAPLNKMLCESVLFPYELQFNHPLWEGFPKSPEPKHESQRNSKKNMKYPNKNSSGQNAKPLQADMWCMRKRNVTYIKYNHI